MKFKAEIDVMPHKELLDPKGKAVASNMKNLSLSDVSKVRIGKHIYMELDANDEATARTMVEKACKELLANPVMESFTFELSQA